MDWIATRSHFLIHLELVLISESLDGRSEELETLRFGLRSEVALLRVVILARAWTDIFIVTLENVVYPALVLGSLGDCLVFAFGHLGLRIDFDSIACGSCA